MPQSWFSSNELSEVDNKKNTTLCKIFEALCAQKKSTTKQRKLFYEKGQEPGEMVYERIAQLRLIAAKSHDQDEMLLDVLVLNSGKVQ